MLRKLQNIFSQSNQITAEYVNSVANDVKKYKVLRDVDLFVLDNSIRETTVGQLRGHTLENKWQVYGEVKRCGFNNIILADFSSAMSVDEVFIQQLVDSGEDRKGMFAFSEITAGIKDGIPDTEQVPVGLSKHAKYGLVNPIIEVDLRDEVYDFSNFTMDNMCALVEKWVVWAYENLSPDAKVFVNLRDLSDVMAKEPIRAFQLVEHLARMSEGIRPFGVLFEEGRGTCLPEECGNWAKYIRKIMDANGWKGKLLVHVHEKYGFADSAQLQSLMFGCDGTWGSICIEGAATGNASTCVTLVNLIRLGNKKVLDRYNCTYLRKAAINVTKITTCRQPHTVQPVYGERVLDTVFSLSKEEFDLAEFFGEESPLRITSMASDEMIRLHLVRLFGEDPRFSMQRARKMKEVILDDLRNNRKEEYMSAVGFAVLFRRSGGHMTPRMKAAVGQMEVINRQTDKMLAEVRQILFGELDGAGKLY